MTLLSGIRVIESAVLLNGDTVGMYLGDLGADVIKIESPPAGDYLRYFLGQIRPGYSVPHLQVNKNKRSVFVDLKSPDGLEVFWRLLDTADVFVDGNRPGVCDRLGIGYEAQRQRVPHIVYVQHTGFGSKGPYANIPPHGMMMGALAGAHPLQVGDDGLVHQRPVSVDGPEMGGEATAAGAVHAAMYACAALVRAKTTGQGAFIDVAACDATLVNAWLPVVLQRNDSRVTDRSGSAQRSEGELSGARYQFYQTKDGKLVLFGCIEQRFWTVFCDLIDRPDLATRGNEGGTEDVAWGGEDPQLRRELQDVFSTRTLAEWTHLGAEAGLPISPAHQSLADVADDPQIKDRHVFIDGTHPVAGEFSYVGSAARVDGQTYRLRRHAPAPGEHTRELLDELGINPSPSDEVPQT